MIVVDASFTGAWLLPDEGSPGAEKMLKKVLSEDEQLAVPELWIYEMMNLLLTAFRRKRIEESQLTLGIQLFQSIPCIFYDHHAPLSKKRTHAIAQKFGLSAYDASYLELADRLQCRLYSLDDALLTASNKLGLG